MKCHLKKGAPKWHVKWGISETANEHGFQRKEGHEWSLSGASIGHERSTEMLPDDQREEIGTAPVDEESAHSYVQRRRP